MKTLIIVPAFNEAQNIATALKSLENLPLHADIVVVDDGSSDDTSTIARQLGASVLRHPTNLGYGAALQTGYKYAVANHYDYVIQFDGDGQHSPQDVPVVHQALVELGVDMVIGSRFKGDDTFRPGALKSAAIRLFRTVIYMSARQHITDPTSGLKGLSRRVFHYYAQANRLPFDYPDADFVIDVLLHKWTVAEVPVRHQMRTSGRSMHSGLRPLVYMLKVLLSIVAIRLQHAFVSRRPVR